ncbi:hypothetical protein [Clostridium formicaceticum]|uniref:Uncharacterized protein n=1 Tax=Clostridium formicaceticum TaxID=1497 RepID=A0AAC9RMQ7_9CLOT|nr:hypothetical protein [Clostridium formicaceticum]AOY77835.1 hypothetical protein BJL90_19400 [Clostridium formicaceticum]ARE88447.1 hypothetical protein CLFO_28500 [Clostridium formicaceticum]
MKMLFKSITFAIVMFCFSTMIFANSGPVFWQGYPSSAIMVIENSSPIRVENENLVFDFSDSYNASHTINGKVTATYEMFNPTNELQAVQMAFPFVGRIDRLLSEDIVITADDTVLPYTIYIGDVVNSYKSPFQQDRKASFDFASIVSTITESLYRGKHFTENEKGKLYTIDIKPSTDQRINFAVDFNFDYEKTKVLTNGFNRYERDGKKTKIAAWCYKPEVLEVYVLGEDIDLKINAYTDGELKEETDLFTYQISTKKVDVRSYLMAYIKNNTNGQSDSMISDTQLYNLYAKSLDEHFTQNRGYSSEYDLMAQENYERILTLVYTVAFPQNSVKEISVSYRTSGTMDKTETVEPLYSFDYIFNAAKNWSDFKNLNIKIIAPEEAPYIVRSNIEWTKEEHKVYTATLAGLPEDDLSFTLYGKEKITLLDKAGGSLQNTFGYFAPIVVGAIALLVSGITIAVVVRKKRNKYLN